MTVTAKIEGIERLVKQLASLPALTTSGVKTTDELNYIKALVWDMGFVTRVIKPGPKTLWSTNAWGEPKVLTLYAPTGFIRVQRQAYMGVLQHEFEKADFKSHDISEWPKLAEQMMINTAQHCANLISAAAPIDTGELQASIVAAEPGDAALSGNGHGPYGTMDFDVNRIFE